MKQKHLILLMAMAALLLYGCSVDRSDLAGPADGSDSPVAFNLGNEFDWLDFLDGLEYDSIVGTVQPGQGVVMFADLPSWPRNCTFGLNVPPTALPEGGNPVDFTMRIPTYDAYRQNPEIMSRVLVRLGPDGETFQDSLTVYTTWMPWEPFPSEDPLEYFYHIYGEGGEIGEGDIGTPTVTYFAGINRYQISFKVLHFSDWDIKPDPDPPTP